MFYFLFSIKHCTLTVQAINASVHKILRMLVVTLLEITQQSFGIGIVIMIIILKLLFVNLSMDQQDKEVLTFFWKQELVTIQAAITVISMYFSHSLTMLIINF